jgi:TolA-binding protein
MRISRARIVRWSLSDIIYIAISFVMTTVKKIAGISFLPAIFLMTAIVTSAVSSSTGVVGIVFSQSASNQTVEEMNQTVAKLNQTLPESMNQTAAQMNQSAAQMNQSAAQMGNQTSTNQTQASGPELTTSDVQDIRASLEEVKKSITDGKAVDALKTINEIDDKLLVAMSQNPPPMLEKSTDNDDDN